MTPHDPPPDLDHDELRRYGRHLVLPEVGLDGQRRLKGSRVLLVGAGGLGAPMALYLAAAGVGTLGLVDFDAVDASNLQRQVLYGTGDVGRPKLAAARERLHAINPHVAVETFDARLASDNALALMRGWDVVADGTDNFPTRYLVNDACALLGIPNVHGSVFRFEGQVSVFDAARGPCYRCLYPEPPPPGLVPSCAEGGVLGVLPGVVGTLQAVEVLKLLLGAGEPLIGRLLVVDALGARTRELRLRRDPACPLCGERPTIRELIDYEAFCGAGAEAARGEEAVEPIEITAADYAALRARGEPHVLVDVREPGEYQVARIEGAVLIPLRTVPSRLPDIPRDQLVVLYCHHGARSRQALEFLRSNGYTRLRNLRGGIDAWSRDVDRAVPRY